MFISENKGMSIIVSASRIWESLVSPYLMRFSLLWSLWSSMRCSKFSMSTSSDGNLLRSITLFRYSSQPVSGISITTPPSSAYTELGTSWRALNKPLVYLNFLLPNVWGYSFKRMIGVNSKITFSWTVTQDYLKDYTWDWLKNDWLKTDFELEIEFSLDPISWDDCYIQPTFPSSSTDASSIISRSLDAPAVKL